MCDDKRCWCGGTRSVNTGAEIAERKGLGAGAFLPQPRQTYLSSSAGKGTRISGSANGSSLPHIILQPEGGRTVSSKVFVRLPRLAEVLGALQHHGSRPGRLEDHDQVGEVEGGLQVQADGLAGGIVGRLPPGAGQAERGVGHGGGGVRQPRVGPAAAPALGAPAAPLRVLAVAAEGLGGAPAARRVGAQRPPVRQVAHPRVAGLVAGTARCRHTCGAQSGAEGGSGAGSTSARHPAAGGMQLLVPTELWRGCGTVRHCCSALPSVELSVSIKAKKTHPQTFRGFPALGKISAYQEMESGQQTGDR